MNPFRSKLVSVGLLPTDGCIGKSSLTTCSGRKDGLALNHPPFVIAVVGNNCAVPKEGNSGSRRGKGNASLPQKTEDVPPSILIFPSEDIVEDVLQRPPLKEGCATIAEPVVNLNEGLREGVGAEAVCQLEEHGVGGVVDVDGGHGRPLSAPFSRETL